MQKLTLSEVAKMINGRIVKGEESLQINGIAVDSRLCKQGTLFFALSGSVTDGHNFIHNAKEGGAAAAVVNKNVDIEGIALILVDDTFTALQEAAKSYREKFNIPFIGVTGSSGKTTTKDLIASVLSVKYNVHKTQGNLNSSTGVPLTIFDLDDENEISVIEMSMSHKGEILGNANIVKPDCAVMTNIGVSHIEFLGSQENIFKAKCEILEYFKDDNTLIYNADDMFLAKLKNKNFNTIGFGINEGGLIAENIIESNEGVNFEVTLNGSKESFSFKYPGMHNVRNCLAAISVGNLYNLNPKEIQKGLDLFSPGSNRMQQVEKNNIVFINDTYNANPDSVLAAVDMLNCKSGNRRIAVLGDMLELGEDAKKLHFKTGENIAENVDVLLTIGEFGQDYISGYDYLSGKESHYFESKTSLTDYLEKVIKNGDTILFKASRGVKLEEVFTEITERLK